MWNLLHKAYVLWLKFCMKTVCFRGHLQTKIFTLNVIVTLKGGGGLWHMNMTLIFEISIARAQTDIDTSIKCSHRFYAIYGAVREDVWFSASGEAKKAFHQA